MVITELKNRDDAKAFLNALSQGSGVTDRPYAGHLLFLVTGLELDRATMLLGALRELDVVTGPYIACHVFVGKIEVPTYRTLVGMGGPRAETNKLSSRQIEGLCRGPLNHIELDNIRPSDLTFATESIARALGIVGHLPCVVVVDASEVASSGDCTIVDFPCNRDELVIFVRTLLGAVTTHNDTFRVQAGILETIHELFDRRERLKRQRAAPAALKVHVLQPIFRQVVQNPSMGLRNLKRVRKIVGPDIITLASQAACLDRSELREAKLATVLQQLVADDEKLALDIHACEEQIRCQCDMLVEGHSLSKVVAGAARTKRFVVTEKAMTAAANGELKSTLFDATNSSFWLRLFRERVEVAKKELVQMTTQLRTSGYRDTGMLPNSPSQFSIVENIDDINILSGRSLLGMAHSDVADRSQEFWSTSANLAKIGIVTALSKEAVAVLKALDEVGVTARNGVVYDIGLAAGIDGIHRVVHATLTGMGNTAAAVVGTRMLHQFPDIQHIIMVGIAGMVPDPADSQKHARLGDVVISSVKGVIEFDYKKEGDGWEEMRSAPTRPGPRLLDAVARLHRKEEDGTPPEERPWVTPIAAITQSLRVTHPAEEMDILHSAEEPFDPIEHPADYGRRHGIPRVHVAPIASSGTLLKNPKRRDQLGQQFGVRAVEMEGAGVSEAAWAGERGYLVIRGGCDYCDKFKNDEWQRYAAVVAAAYLSALLKVLAVT